jgi:hypothetical protein
MDLHNLLTGCWGVSFELESTYIPVNLGKKDGFVSHLCIFVILHMLVVHKPTRTQASAHVVEGEEP